MTYRKKLIEVALPLEAINKESAREKSIRHGHPSTLHLWWARRPLAACRAVLFASLVDDPSAWPELFPTDEDQEAERQRLFRIIEELVKWESTTNQIVLLAAQTEIARSIARNREEDLPEGADAVRKYLEENAPPVLDPFCGGGSIPLEAQRLGLRAYASDLNPVAVLITKALIEIPPKFAGKPPVNPEARKEKTLLEKEWKGAEGLAEDVRYYGKWMRDEAEKRIGHLYPKVQITEEMAENRPDLKPYIGQVLTIAAWLWARIIRCPNPACGGTMPLISTFVLSRKKKQKVLVEPIIDRERKIVEFSVHVGEGNPPNPPKIGRGAKFKCLLCGEVVESQHIKREGMAGRLESQLMAIVAEGARGRVYINPLVEQSEIALSAKPSWKPEATLADDKRAIWCPLYGLDTFDKLFTNRQLVALTTFSDLVREAREKALDDIHDSGSIQNDNQSLGSSFADAAEYCDAISTYLAFSVDRSADLWCSICTWANQPTKEHVAHVFGRQAIPMAWDFAEANPFSNSGGNFEKNLGFIVKGIGNLPATGMFNYVEQSDATASVFHGSELLVSTDPPYYDNIGYADLSDFFYVWMRQSLITIYPQLFSTMLTPKKQELIASPYRHDGSKEKAERFFEDGLGKAFRKLHEVHDSRFPLAIYYGFKQAEEDKKPNDTAKNVAIASTGWETMLEGVRKSGFYISGTWPIRTEREHGLKTGANVLASSIVLVCRPRPDDAPMITRREFILALKNELPNALINLQHGNIAPVDLAQASIGPGMAVFTRYSKVMEADGSPMTVRAALVLINQTLDEVLTEQEGEFDADTRWAVAWFEQFGLEEGAFGMAETLSKAKDTSVNGMVEAGILYSRAGKVRLLQREELLEDWDPATDRRFTIWEAAQYLIRALDQKGEQGAADLLRKLGAVGESARDLAYRLYNICERKKWAQEALAYNSLVIAWPEISRLAQGAPSRVEAQTGMFENE